MDSPAEPVQTGNPKDVYRAYPMTAADRVRLLHQFPPRISRVIADHISAEGLRSMDKVRECAATEQVIGVANRDKYQALVVALSVGRFHPSTIRRERNSARARKKGASRAHRAG
jgi:hypothetical protein